MKIYRYIAVSVLLLLMAMVTFSCARTDTAEMPTETTGSVVTEESTTAQPSYTDTETTIDTAEQETTVDTDPPKPLTPPAQITSFTVPKENNRNMCESLTGEISEGKILLTVTAPTDTYSLKTATVSLEHDGILTYPDPLTQTVDLTSPDCCFIVTNEDGVKTKYTVELRYAKNLIPVVSIDTADGKDILSKDYYMDATISIDTSGVDGWYLPQGFSALAPTKMEIKGRGNSTWEWEKKPYKFKFDEKISVLGLTPAKKWVLLANYSDMSLMRNYVVMDVAKVISTVTSPFSQFPVNLFVNGEYRGIYSIGEDHDVGAGRVELPDDTGVADTSFMLEIGGYDETEDVFGKTVFSTELVRWCTIEHPDDEDVTQEQADFIIDYVTKADTAVKSLYGYEEYIDVDALINWFIANELFYNLESCFNRSCYMTKVPGGKLTMGPLWDYDLAMGNLYNDFGRYDIWACLAQGYGYIGDNWMCYLMKDPNFRAKLRTRWDEVKDELLTTALNRIDRMEQTLAPSAEYNFAVWDILGTRAVRPQPVSIKNLKTYADHVKYIRNFIENRWNWMDANI